MLANVIKCKVMKVQHLPTYLLCVIGVSYFFLYEQINEHYKNTPMLGTPIALVLGKGS